LLFRLTIEKEACLPDTIGPAREERNFLIELFDEHQLD